jgi:hypothetical protein
MAAELVPANPYTLKPGNIVFFRNAGTGPAVPCRIETRGPLNQFRITFIDQHGQPLPGGHAAVNEGRELWITGGPNVA